MKTKTLTAITFIVLLIGGAEAQTAATTNLNTVLINTDPVPVQSGDDAKIRFKVRNTGNTAAEDVEVTIKDRFPFELKPDRKRTYELGTVNPGEEYYITTEVLVAEDSPDGQNNLKAETSNGNDFSVTQKIPISVQSSNIDLNLANLQTTPTSLMPDTDDNQMAVEVVNNGEKTAENVILNLDLPSFFEKTSSFSSRQALGNIQPGQIKPATFSFDIDRNASSGEVEIPTEVSYSAGNETGKVVKQLSFSTNLEGKPQFEVSGVKSGLRTRGAGQIKMKITNVGSVKSGSTRIRLLDSSDLPFSFGSSSQYIGTLEAGQSGTAVFDVTTDSEAAAKDYLLDFEVRGVKDTEVFVEDTTVKTGVSQGQQNSSAGVPLPLIGALLLLIGVIYYFRGRLRDLQ